MLRQMKSNLPARSPSFLRTTLRDRRPVEHCPPPGSHQDAYKYQVQTLVLSAWNKRAEGSNELPFAGITQKAEEDSPTFIDSVEKNIQRKFPLPPTS